MKVHLMYRDRDFDVQQGSQERHFNRHVEMKSKLLANEEDLTQDLELNTLFSAMAGGDEFLFPVVRKAVLSGLKDDLETILYRQAVLKDCLRNYSVVKTIYDIAVEAIEGKRRNWLGLFGHSPGSILYSSVQLVQLFTGFLGKLRRVADEHSNQFESEGFTTFFAMLKTELADDYLIAIQAHLKKLMFPGGVLVSAQLGEGNRGTNYVLRESQDARPRWMQWIFDLIWPDPYTFRIADRDEAGARALGELKDRGVNLVANALAQSADHILSFLVMLRTELAFFVGCVNLHRQLVQKRTPVCFPIPAPPGTRRHSCAGLCDVCLALKP